MKKCPACEVSKATSEFYKDKSKKDGLSWGCKECVKARVNSKRIENIDEYNSIQRERVRRRVVENKGKVPDKNKTCPMCNENKGSDHFWKNVAHPSGLAVYCKACESIRAEVAKKNDPDYYKKQYARAREKQLAYYKKRREIDPQPLRDAVNRWRANNRDHARAYTAKRRERINKSGGNYTKHDVAKIRELQNNKCAACKVCLSGGYHVDHIMPIALGGTNCPDNLQVLCPPCNLSKHAKDPIAWANERGLLI